MSIRKCLTSVGMAVAMAGGWAAPTSALTMQECSVKYKQAESTGTLKGMSWNAFRKAECGASSVPASATTTAAQTTAVRIGAAVFPSAVSPKYANQSAGKARMHTCLDQYKANKTASGNNGLKWIQKGGGYYSECNKRLTR
ncbi:MAG: hypothetical protein ACKVP3_25350 [Hyphomicrobiaceae bacterium]